MAAESLGAHRDEGDAALGDLLEGAEAGGAAGSWWCTHIADSRLALGREGFRFPGLEPIENEEEKKSQSW
jgi:hypothetical protein